jgi:putative ABC transport system permease protein
MILKLSLKNVMRNKRRTLITVAVISVGVSMLLLALAYTNYVDWGVKESIIHSSTGHFQVLTRDMAQKEEEKILQFGIDNWLDLAQKISKVPGVKVVCPRINFSGLGSTGDKSTGVLVQAVEPDKELKLGDDFIDREAYRKLKAEPDGALLGPALAKLLNVKTGDMVTIMTTTGDGALNAGDYKMVGTFSAGVEELDKRFVLVSIQSAKALLVSEKVERLAVGLYDTNDIPIAMNQARTVLPPDMVMKLWKEVNSDYEKILNFFFQMIAFLLPVLMIIVWFSTMNTVLMSVMERSAELATFRAMGTSRFRMFRMLFSEGVWIGIIGVAIGFILELIFASLINHAHIMLPPPPGNTVGYELLVRNTPGIFVFVGLLTILVVSLSTVLPARRIFRLSIVKAIRGQ